MCQIPYHGGVGLPRRGDLAITRLEHVPQDLYRKILSYECTCPDRGFGHGFHCRRSHWIAWMSTVDFSGILPYLAVIASVLTPILDGSVCPMSLRT